MNIESFKTALRWCQTFMTDADGNLRSADGRKLTPPDDIAEALDAAYHIKCSVCDGMGYSVGVSKRLPCESCGGKGYITDERMPAPAAEDLENIVKLARTIILHGGHPGDSIVDQWLADTEAYHVDIPTGLAVDGEAKS